MQHFVLTFRRSTAELLTFDVFDPVDRADSLRRHRELELAHHGSEDVEVVLLGAEDEAQLRRTHGRYFSESAAVPRSA